MTHHVLPRALGIACLFAIGCDFPSPEAPPPAPAETRSTLRLQNHLTFPYRLERLLVAMDGAVLRNRTYAPDEEPEEIALPIEGAPGSHFMQMLAVVQVAQTALGPECGLEVRRSEPFVLSESRSTTLSADLHLRGVQQPFEDRVALEVTVSPPATDHRWPDDPRCRELAGAEQSICHVEANIAQAKRDRDVIKVICHKDKLDRMTALARARDEVPADLDEHGLRARARLIDAQITSLEREADQCGGGPPIFLGGTQVTARSCAAALPDTPEP